MYEERWVPANTASFKPVAPRATPQTPWSAPRTPFDAAQPPASASPTPPVTKRSRRRGVLGGLLVATAAAGASGAGAGIVTATLTLRRTGQATLNPTGAGASVAPGAAGAAAVLAAPAAPAAVQPPVQLGFAGGVDLRALYRRLAPAVVSVQTASAAQARRSGQDPFVVPSGMGSGFFVDDRGHAITNHHVIRGASRVTLQLLDGTRIAATVVATEPANDLAVLRATVPDGQLSVAALGDSDTVEPGEPAIAIGSPFGLEHTITAGIVSATNRTFGTSRGARITGLIQIDAPINPGNSGGPLFNAAGEVIGITTGIESPVRGNVGVGFAVPINAARRLLSQLA